MTNGLKSDVVDFAAAQQAETVRDLLADEARVDLVALGLERELWRAAEHWQETGDGDRLASVVARVQRARRARLEREGR